MDEVESASFDNGSERYMTILTRISPYTYPMTPIGDAGMRRDPPPDLTQKEQSIALLSFLSFLPSCRPHIHHNDSYVCVSMYITVNIVSTSVRAGSERGALFAPTPSARPSARTAALPAGSFRAFSDTPSHPFPLTRNSRCCTIYARLKPRKTYRSNPPLSTDPDDTWRLFDVTLRLADDPGKDAVPTDIPPALLHALTKTLRCTRPLSASVVSAETDPHSRPITIVRKSLDARFPPPVFAYTVDVPVALALAAGARPGRTTRPGLLENAPPPEPLSADEALVELLGLVPREPRGGEPVRILSPSSSSSSLATSSSSSSGRRPHVVVVGAGPAGYFAALGLARGGAQVTVLERGRGVEQRGRDIGALMVRGILRPDSNLCCGEGGAGTWSDGKLTTRIGRNAGAVRTVLRTLVELGAPASILTAGKPHLGTDRMVRILRAFRDHLVDMGVDIRFDSHVTDLAFHHHARGGGREEGEEGKERLEYGSGSTGPRSRRIRGVYVSTLQESSSPVSSFSSISPSVSSPVHAEVRRSTPELLACDHVVLAVGHSARDMYAMLLEHGVQLAPKPFAVGFRIEHPQVLIDAVQYGDETAAAVLRGKGPVPVAEYRLATTVGSIGEPKSGGLRTIVDSRGGTHVDGDHRVRVEMELEMVGEEEEEVKPSGGGDRPSRAFPSSRSVYSFCMCPGGQVVPTSVHAGELCVNGMSFSRRDSKYANAALVVTIDPNEFQHLHDDLDKIEVDTADQNQDRSSLSPSFSPLIGVDLQRRWERRAARMAGGGGLQAPAQRVSDFLRGVPTPPDTLPGTSYRLGLISAPLHDLYPPVLTNALREALGRFERRIPGFAGSEALLIGVETRTSAPVTMVRDPETFVGVGTVGLYPCGEGAGYAGGIMSAAVDGLRVAQAVLVAEGRALGGRGTDKTMRETY